MMFIFLFDWYLFDPFQNIPERVNKSLQVRCDLWHKVIILQAGFCVTSNSSNVRNSQPKVMLPYVIWQQTVLITNLMITRFLYNFVCWFPSKIFSCGFKLLYFLSNLLTDVCYTISSRYAVSEEVLLYQHFSTFETLRRCEQLNPSCVLYDRNSSVNRFNI